MTRHLSLTPLTGLAAAAIVALAPAAATAQDDTAPVSGDITAEDGLKLRGELDGERFDVWANVLGITPHDSEETLTVYCIDIRTDLDFDSPYTEGDWDGAGVPNLEQVRWVLFNGYPNVGAGALVEAAGGESTDDWEAADLARAAYAGTQAAVWHFTDGFDLDPDEPVIEGSGAAQVDDAVWDVYTHLTENVGRVGDPSEFHIDLEGADTAVWDQGRFGPYTIRTNAGPVALTAEGGDLVDADGDPVESLNDGEQFYIVLEEGSEQVTVSGTATFDLPVGRVFLATTDEWLDADALNPLTTMDSQKLILAEPREKSIPAEWVFALEMPEGDQPTESASAAPKLPVTGSSLAYAFGAGLALVIGGLAATVLAARRRGVAG